MLLQRGSTYCAACRRRDLFQRKEASARGRGPCDERRAPLRWVKTRAAPLCEPEAMKTPPEILFLGIEASPAIESVAREKALKLGQFCSDITSCRVSIELLQKHQHQGRPFSVRIDLTMPGCELVISRVHDEDVYIALRDAFDGMKRQVEDAVRRGRRRRE